MKYRYINRGQCNTAPSLQKAYLAIYLAQNKAYIISFLITYKLKRAFHINQLNNLSSTGGYLLCFEQIPPQWACSSVSSLVVVPHIHQSTDSSTSNMGRKSQSQAGKREEGLQACLPEARVPGDLTLWDKTPPPHQNLPKIQMNRG